MYSSSPSILGDFEKHRRPSKNTIGIGWGVSWGWGFTPEFRNDSRLIFR